MIYICPTCGKEFDVEEKITSHFLKCWKEQHPYHKSKSAPHSANRETKEVSNDILDFFNSLERK